MVVMGDATVSMKSCRSFMMCLLLVSLSSSRPLRGDPAQRGNLKLLDVVFEPIGQGKNVVQVKAQNLTDREQTLGVHIFTKPPRYGRGMGWGAPFFSAVKAGQSQSARFVFKIQGPITEDTWLRLRFYNPESPDRYDSDKFFGERRYSSSDLKHRKQALSSPVPDADRRAQEVRRAFDKLQSLVRQKEYKEAWGQFTQDYQAGEFQGEFVKFSNTMDQVVPDCLFWWDRIEFLGLHPQSVFESGEVLMLAATNTDQTWNLDFVQRDGQWQVDWIGGYVCPKVRHGDWEERLLPKMQKQRAEHFDIYYFEGSTAAKRIGAITGEREQGYSAVCTFLGQDQRVRIRLVLFEDEKTKVLETGHQGMGWAFGNTIVEVYNNRQQLDPYHEMTHILMRSYGDPPALFNEGAAVYMSERMGAKALRYLGGGDSSVHERATQLKREGTWIPLRELLTYNEIGSKESRPPIAYAEAGSFVRFLIDTYGKDKFLAAYGKTKNARSQADDDRNADTLKRMYGQPVSTLVKQWESTLLVAETRPH